MYAHGVQRNSTPPLQGLPVLLASNANHDGLLGLKPVRIVTRNEVSPPKIKSSLSAEAWKCFLGTAKLKMAYETKDPLLMRDGYRLLSEGHGFPRELNFANGASSFTNKARGPVGSIRHFLPDFVNQELQEARIVLWWNSRLARFMSGIFCPDFQTAVYTRLLMDALFDEGWRICPHCGKWFLRTPKRKFYDSIRCQAAHRVRRWRERKKGANK
jgi:hypothetical protein